MAKTLTHRKARTFLREQLKRIDPAKDMDTYLRVVNRLKKLDNLAEPKSEKVVKQPIEPVEETPEPQETTLISGCTVAQWALTFCTENVLRGDGGKLSFRQSEWLAENFPGETFTIHPIELADSVAELKKLRGER